MGGYFGKVALECTLHDWEDVGLRGDWVQMDEGLGREESEVVGEVMFLRVCVINNNAILLWLERSLEIIAFFVFLE